ncbi:MAG TPA: PAS domain S-box protein [Spirochaetota bacterium]|nr:PAS domain S-box protein [Spirochaetota bacterium]
MTDKELKTILLVEDETISARLSTAILVNNGYNVVQAATGGDAVTIVQTEPGIDLVLMDIELGDGIDGAQAARMILAEHDIPLLFYSSHTEPEITAKTDGIGSFGYIVKNTGEAVLIASIKTGYSLFETNIKKHKNYENALRESNERYKSIEEVFNTGIWEYNTVSGRMVCNHEYYQMLGLVPGDCGTPGTQNINTAWLDLLHPDDKEKSLEIFLNFHAHGSAGTYENYYRMRHSNGKWIWIWSRGCALKDKTGNSTDLVIGVHINITRFQPTEEVIVQKNKELTALNAELGTINNIFTAINKELVRINNKLEESEKHYCTLFENTGSGIIVIEEDSTISLVNQFFADSSGYSREEIENKKKLTDIFCDEDQGLLLTGHFLKRDNLEKMKPGFEFCFRNRYNQLLHYLVFISPIPGTAKSIASVIDITERKNAEAALKAAEGKYRDLFMNSQIGIFITEINSGLVLEANDRFAREYGFKNREAILAQPVFMKDLYIQEGVRETMLSLMKTHGEIRNYEVQFKRIDGSLLWIRYSAMFNIDKGLVTGVTEDITDLKQSESAKNAIYNELLASEKKYRLLFENSAFGLIHFNNRGIITDCNTACEKVTGLTWNDLVGYDMLKLDNPVFKSAVASALNGHPGEYEGSYKIKASSRLILIRLQLETIYDENENIIGGVGIVEDISDKRAAERAMLDELEKERSRIGHILHDSLGQKLGAVLYLVQAYSKKYKKTGKVSNSDIDKLVVLASSALDETRSLSRGLDFPAIDTGGFNESLDDIAVKIRTIYGIEVMLEVQDSLMQYSKLKLTNLYYIILESINNAVRHGKAYKILLQYSVDQAKGLFTIISYQRVLLKYNNPGMGLRIMKYRAEASGMEFSISSEMKKISVKVGLGDIPDTDSSDQHI